VVLWELVRTRIDPFSNKREMLTA